jgi:hypothetical protein
MQPHPRTPLKIVNHPGGYNEAMRKKGARRATGSAKTRLEKISAAIVDEAKKTWVRKVFPGTFSILLAAGS